MNGKQSVMLCLLLVLAAALYAARAPHRASPVSNGDAPFDAKTTTQTGVLHLPKPADAVFPLFGPVREMEWAEGWEPQLLVPANTTPREGMVFTIRRPGEADTLWIVSRLDAGRHEITYVTVSPGNRVGVLTIACAAGESGSSVTTVTHSFTALGPLGNTYIEAITRENFTKSLSAWEHGLRYFLETGKRPHHHG